MLNNINVKSDQSLWRELLQEIQWARRQSKPGIVAAGSLLRKKGTEVSAGFSRLQCLFKSSSSSLCIGKEWPFQAVGHWEMLSGFDTVTENGSVLAYLRPGGAVEFCHGLGASEQPLAHDSLCREAMSKKPVSNHVVDGRREWGRVPCLQTEKAASLTSFTGYDPLLHWAPIQPALDLHGITQIAEPAEIKMQETNWEIVLQAPL